MGDNTGAPWNIPYVEPSDLVRDYPAADEAQALAIAAGLDAAGGLVAVKHALFTGTQTNSTAAGANFAVTDLSITHEVADSANKLIIAAVIGALGTTQGLGKAGLAIDDGTGLIGVGDAASARPLVTTGGNVAGLSATANVAMPSAYFVHTPGAGSKTYTVRAVNIDDVTRTLYINRSERDNDGADARAASSLVIMEVKV